jgi:hypothetical protein
MRLFGIDIELGGPPDEETRLLCASDAELLSEYDHIYDQPDEEPERIYAELRERGIDNPLHATRRM